MTIVVDASVGLKWFFVEAQSDLAYALLRGDEPLAAPSLIVAETCNAAWKAVRLRTMTPAQADCVAVDLSSLLNELHPIGPLAPRAMAIARRLDHPVYDCFYIALAEHLDSTLVTADSRLVRRLHRTAWARRLVDLTHYTARKAP